MARNKVEKLLPPGTTKVTQKLLVATANFWSCSVMVKTITNGNKKWDISELVYDYWQRVFPGEGLRTMTLHKAMLMISYQLIYAGFVEFGIKLNRKFEQNYDFYISGVGSPDKTEKYYRTWGDMNKYRKTIIIEEDFE